MLTTVKCGKCRTIFDEDTSEPEEKREPCPNCGSMARRYESVQADVVTAKCTVTAIGTFFSTANLLLQTVIVPEERTAEGQLIEAVALPWFEIVQLLKDDPSVAFQISPRKWEEIIAGVYKRAEFDEVTLTPRSGDLGRDVIAVKRAVGTIRIIDQVKAYKKGHLVTADDVRALMGVLQGDGASKGFLTTTSDFAPKLKYDPLITPFMPSRLELINGKMLLKRLEDLASKR